MLADFPDLKRDDILAALSSVPAGPDFLIDAPGSRAKRERSALLRAAAPVVPGLADHRAGSDRLWLQYRLVGQGGEDRVVETCSAV